MRTFKLVGHRGSLDHAPENSLESFRVGEAQGADCLELDLRLTKDGEVIVNHDADLARMVADPDDPAATVPVREMTLAEARAVQLKSGEPLVTFAELLDGTSVLLELELKETGVIEQLESTLRASDAMGRVRFTSFQPAALEEARDRLPEIPRALIVSKVANADAHEGGRDATLERLGADGFYTGFEGLDADLVQSLAERGIHVHCWMIATEDDVNRALELGAVGGTSNDVKAARGWVDKALATA